MAIVRQLSNGNKVTDWTEEVMEVENQYGLLNGMNLFTGRGTSQESIIFEKEYKTRTLIPQTSRRGKAPSKGKDHTSAIFSIALPYFSTSDYITPSDIQGQRKVGTPEAAQDLASAIAMKLEDMRLNVDQTREFMKIEAIKGKTVDPEMKVIADMFTEFNITQKVIDFELGTAATDVDEKIRELKRYLAKNAKTGGKIGGFTVMVSPEFFDALVSHPKIREAYMQYTVVNPNSDVVRGDLSKFTEWGVTDTFVHQGVTFFSYDASFELPDLPIHYAIGDGTKGGIATEGGYTMVTGVRDLFRAYFGPANTLSGANQVGQEIFAYQWTDPKDKFHEMEMEMSPLYVMMRPQLSVKVISTK